MLAKKPEQRFPSMREAAQALEHELELLPESSAAT